MNAKAINAKMTEAGIAGYAKDWQGRRVYINLDACDRSFAGDRNYQLYLDIATQKLVSKAGKGTLSRAFSEATRKVEALFN
jgi:hypothetical protein